MIGSSTILQAADTLSALLVVLADPEKTKAQLDELSKSAQAAKDAETKLVEERVEIQNLRMLAENLIHDSDALVQDASSTVARAGKIVSDSVRDLQVNRKLAVDVVLEARDIVTKMQIAAQDAADAYNNHVSEQEAKITALNKEIETKQARLDDINAQLEKLRGTIGV